MSGVLFLCHRIPYPPNKGDKVRSYHILMDLARDHRVHLGAFVDDADDWRHLGSLERFCTEVHLEGLNPRLATLRAGVGMLTGEAMTLPYYRSRSMARWVRSLAGRSDIDRVLVFSSAMAQYVAGSEWDERRRVVDFVDVDSEKWRAYGDNKTWPVSAVYHREGKRLLAYERRVAAWSDAGVFVSEAEAALFRERAPESRERITHVRNGVDTEYFSPHRDYPNPFPEASSCLVFTGAMDYWPNIDAALWFAHEVFPLVRRELPDLLWYVVGARPVPAIRGLEREAGIVVTGTVPDVRPYLGHAKAAVAPLRVARGIQNKILEAMAMGLPVVATRFAVEGIDPFMSLEDMVADESRAMARNIVELLKGDAALALGAAGRAFVESQYDWRQSLLRLRSLLAEERQSYHPTLPMERLSHYG